MFDFVVALMLYSFWIAFFGIFGLLTVLRLIVSIKSKLTLKKMLFVVLTPCSIGYFVTFKSTSLFKKVYEALSIFFFVMILIGSVMVYYVHFE